MDSCHSSRCWRWAPAWPVVPVTMARTGQPALPVLRARTELRAHGATGATGPTGPAGVAKIEPRESCGVCHDVDSLAAVDDSRMPSTGQVTVTSPLFAVSGWTDLVVTFNMKLNGANATDFNAITNARSSPTAYAASPAVCRRHVGCQWTRIVRRTWRHPPRLDRSAPMAITPSRFWRCGLRRPPIRGIYFRLESRMTQSRASGRRLSPMTRHPLRTGSGQQRGVPATATATRGHEGCHHSYPLDAGSLHGVPQCGEPDDSQPGLHWLTASTTRTTCRRRVGFDDLPRDEDRPIAVTLPDVHDQLQRLPRQH